MDCSKESVSIQMSGYLDKKGRSQMSSWRWKRYWCTLKDNQLCFSNSQDSGSVKEPIHMSKVDAVYRDSSIKKLTAFTLQMKGERRSFNTSSHEECSKWISCLQIAINESKASMRFQNQEQSQENANYVTATLTDGVPRFNEASSNDRLVTVYSEPWDSSESQSTFYTQMSKKSEKLSTLVRKPAQPTPPPESPVWYASSEVIMKKFNFQSNESFIDKPNENDNKSLRLPEPANSPPSPVVMRNSVLSRSSVSGPSVTKVVDSSPEISDVSSSDDSDDTVTISDIDDAEDPSTDFTRQSSPIPTLQHDGFEDASETVHELKMYLINNSIQPFVLPRVKEQGFYVQQLRDFLAILDTNTRVK
ncbi:uncharacterized protein LOC141904615 [Tubulanus polymorphus]|uniref:uncharacterized protein LOC141904615 n=1 Tax=Tubulanus polymorphus TaxID=672921 RepID=UPI003DA257DD